MAIKIMIDAGHYSGYNPSPVYPSYKEGNMTFKLQGYLKAELEKYGFVVGVTRTVSSKDLSLYNRGYMAKGYDLFISLHSNACGTASVDRVVIIKGYDQPSTLANKFGRCISDAMGISSAHQVMIRKGSSGGEYYGVLRGAKAAGVANRFILEHSFHTNKAAAQWLYSDANLKKLAVAEAKMIAEHYGYSIKQPAPTTGFKKYIVRTTADSLNGRKGPGTNYAVVQTVPKDTAVTIVEEKMNGSTKWGKTKSGYWIALSYTKFIRYA